MQIRSTLVLALAAGGTTFAAEPAPVPAALAAPTDAAACDVSCAHAPAGVSPLAHAATMRMIEVQTFNALPARDRAVISAKLAEQAAEATLPGFEDGAPAEMTQPMSAEEIDARFATVEKFVSREAFERFTPQMRRLLSNFAEMASADDWVPVAPCFVPGTDFAYIEAFDAIVSYGLSNGTSIQFEQTGRWNGTALDPSGGGQGNPTILTYSFPPDGTTVPSGVGEPTAPNNLNAFLDARYGNRAAWRAIYDDMFARWGELSGNTYVLEPNDDGSTLFNNAGVSGVRGDLRMAGKPIDGNSGTLAYNFFPQNGDMVIDTADSFYNGNVLRLRNVLSHEHGHGMGQLHTCPVTNSKLMEPFINLNFDGPQFDDILNAQRHYGDPNEPNNAAGAATGLGTFGIDSSTTVDTVSIDDDTDVDFYSFTINQDSEVTVTLRPQGFLYQAGPQTQSCNEQQPYNPLLFLDPAIQILNANGTSLIASADANPAGGNETISVSLDAGSYTIRASGGSPSGDQIIAYELDLDVGFDALSISEVDLLPQQVDPGVPVSFDVNISPDGENLVGTPVLQFRNAAGDAFTPIAMVNVSGETWRATIPAQDCGDSPEFRVQAVGSISGPQFFPAGDAAVAAVGELVASFEDNGQVDLGYSTASSAADGQWELGVPRNNGRGDPATDFDGSGSCWLTDNTAATDNSDVDDGAVVLTSPALDLTEGSTVSYAYWFNDIDGGPIQGGDTFRVQISIDGGTFVTVRTYSTPANAWRTDTLVQGADYPASAIGGGQIRFIVDDIGTQNVVEGGVDAIVVSSLTCEDPQPNDPCNVGDLAEPFGVLDLTDVDAFIAAFTTQDPSADIAAPFGVIDLSDVDGFIAAFLAGCP